MRSIYCACLTALLLLSSTQAQPSAGTKSAAEWWKSAVIYEIYPRSFADSNGDGVGDLNGIAKRLDYLKDLGVDAIWITPFYPSPQVDFGYDISDFVNIDPKYGTLADFDRLVAEAKKRNIRVLADLVLNHTSNQHPWFVDSRSSRTSAKADWYVWRDPKPNGQPPNNWISIFGHSAWELAPTRGQFYYHEFYKEQPDLNWRNPAVRKAIYDVMRFWMKRGVAGFRLDAFTMLFEDAQFRDEPVARPGANAYGDPILTSEYTNNLPELHDVMKEMRKVTEEFSGRVLIGETYLPGLKDMLALYGENNDEVQLPMDTQFGFIDKLDVRAFRIKLREAETGLRGNTPLLVFENHDRPRLVNRYGDGKHNEAIAKLLATLLLAPRGSALMYFGQEIGMENHDPQRVEDVLDPIGKLGWPKEKGRDGVRTPMQWDTTANAGFSTAAKTWLPVGSDYKARNVAAQMADPNSILNYYRALIRLRRENVAMREGTFELLAESDPNVLCWTQKASDGSAIVVALNFTGTPQTMPIDRGTQGKIALSSFADGKVADLKNLTLPAYGAVIATTR